MASVAVLVASEFEDSELGHPVSALKEHGHHVTTIGVKENEKLAGKNGKETVVTDAAVTACNPRDYDALLIPGGYSPDKLRIDADVVNFVKQFAELKRPIAAICHGPQLMIEAEVVKGRTMTSWPSVRTDLGNAGANVVDREVCVDKNYITSRKPDDLDAFTKTFLDQLS